MIIYSLSKEDTTKPDPPQVYFKTLNRPPQDKMRKQDEYKGNLNEIFHFVSHRRSGAGPIPTQQELLYSTKLRKYDRP